MRGKKYYWTLAVLALLFVFVIAADVAGFIGLFTGGKTPVEDAPAVTDEIVSTEVPGDEAPAETETPTDAETPADADLPAETDDSGDN